ncbi:DUF2384 domain-containing protein [Pseudomonas sp. MF6751]|uniref:antitoxin Xre/MbcA/ParS toxin-binding domain-containing protein n=1 Tax=Pseudomonas TaxID=286 RepID=UPI00190E3239|nr:DUF2384 domain-containing protein [Pseudomonas sp. MF6751]
MNELRIVGRCVRSPIGCWSARHCCFQARYDHVFSIALGVFGSRRKAHRWLARSAVGVGRQAPCRMLCTSTGYADVHGELLRMDHGMYA